ncbi:hypothetical protein QFC19_001718 [Naganishia cerealis]|uniref:Uncharacterized protein n=1 Tax=Naganishia cerealis TaxID=610337 RepID=A0ACC2WG71_9TREE|nr:hypothetical protein QFC19_001718 [Naganishia cerealis]
MDGPQAKRKRSRREAALDNSFASSTVTHKRPRATPAFKEAAGVNVRKDVFEYPEVFLNILSFLPVEDLVTFERVGSSYSRFPLSDCLTRFCFKAKYPYPSVRQQRARQRSPHSYSGNLEQAQHGTVGEPTTTKELSLIPVETPHQAHSLQDVSNALEDIRVPSLSSDELEAQEFSRPRIDWKLLTKIDTNWATGTAAQYSLSPSPSPAPFTLRRAHLQNTPSKRPQQDVSTTVHATQVSLTGDTSDGPQQRQGERHLLALSSPFIFVAYPTSPLLHVHASNQYPMEKQPSDDDELSHIPPLALIPPPPGWSSLSRPDLITCIKVDGNDMAFSQGGTQHTGSIRIAVFYQSGGFVILSIKPHSFAVGKSTTQAPPRLTWCRLLVHKSSNTSSRSRRSVYRARAQGDPVVISEFHSPILISCSQKFYISVWQLPEPCVSDHRPDGSHSPMQGEQDAILLKILHSPVSFHPATLGLKRIIAPNPDQEEDSGSHQPKIAEKLHHYRASLAYTVPLYPERWTLAIQDFDVSILGTHERTVSSAALGTVEIGDCFHAGRSSSSGSYRLPIRWPLRPTSEIVGVKGESAIGIGLDDHFAVLAGSDNQIQVYKVPERSSLQSPELQPVATQDSSSTSSSRRIARQSYGASALRREIKHVQTLLAHSSAITAIALENGRCVSAGNDEKILVWNVDREADILPADDNIEVDLEETGPADILGGWTTVVQSPNDKLNQRTDGAKWSHVEVRTPRKNTPLTTSDRDDTLSHLHSSAPAPSAKPHSLSSTWTLHQQILPMPPVTHPLSLANAAREYLPAPRPRKDEGGMIIGNQVPEAGRARRIVEQLAFNEDRIVGLVSTKDQGAREITSVSGSEESVIKVWTFNV